MYTFLKSQLVTPGKIRTCTEKGKNHSIIGRKGDWEEQGENGEDSKES